MAVIQLVKRGAKELAKGADKIFKRTIKGAEGSPYKNVDDLSDKLNYFKNNDYLRKKIAEKGKIKYFNLFNNKIISKNIIDITF